LKTEITLLLLGREKKERKEAERAEKIKSLYYNNIYTRKEKKKKRRYLNKKEMEEEKEEPFPLLDIYSYTWIRIERRKERVTRCYATNN